MKYRLRCFFDILIVGVLVFFLSGCAHLSLFSQKDYLIHKGDALRVVVYKEYDEKVIVRPDYKISLPLVGEISCKKKTAEDLSFELSEKLKNKTVVMVEATNSFKLKDLMEIMRDISWFYLLSDRINR